MGEYGYVSPGRVRVFVQDYREQLLKLSGAADELTRMLRVLMLDDSANLMRAVSENLGAESEYVVRVEDEVASLAYHERRAMGLD